MSYQPLTSLPLLTFSKHLEFDITDDDQFLQINGQPVYPPPQTLIPIALHASEVRASDQFHTEPLRLGYALEVLPSVAEVTDIALKPIQFTILDLEGLPVHVDTVKIDLIESWGHLHIARVSRLPYAQSPGADRCTTSVCRLGAIVAARVKQMIEAARTHADKAKTWIKNGCHGRKHAQAGTEQNDQKSHHPHGHHHFGRLRRIMRATLHLFVLPALFGIFGGLLACGLGMLVGRAFGLCLNRRSRDEGVRGLEAAIVEDEKDALVENGEMPPQYEAVDVVVVEEK